MYNDQHKNSPDVGLSILTRDGKENPLLNDKVCGK